MGQCSSRRQGRPGGGHTSRQKKKVFACGAGGGGSRRQQSRACRVTLGRPAARVVSSVRRLQTLASPSKTERSLPTQKDVACSPNKMRVIIYLFSNVKKKQEDNVSQEGSLVKTAHQSVKGNPAACLRMKSHGAWRSCWE